ncbi:MAG TPA: three component ABC system middle component [Mycobacteriales bacterium]|nr:three component ABC system middle component [Mycobacteriales bacterium]
MSTWASRPIEEGALLNPAYLAFLLNGVARGYGDESAGTSLPFVLAFLAIPLVATASNRDALPRTVRTSFAVWLDRNPEIRERTPAQARAFWPLVREALLYGNSSGIIRVASDGSIESAESLNPKRTSPLWQLRQKSVLTGRLLARTGEVATALRLVGVSP